MLHKGSVACFLAKADDLAMLGKKPCTLLHSTTHAQIAQIEQHRSTTEECRGVAFVSPCALN